MTEAEEQQLRELGEDLAAAQRSPWEPRCIARAFATPGAHDVVFTMQAWIDLEALRSPLLQGTVPAELDGLEPSLHVLQLSADDLSAEEAVTLAHQVMAAIADAFAMALPMKEAKGASEECQDGFGAWLPIFACLVTQCGLSPAEARALPVAQAYALMAAHRRNQGWLEAGQPYTQRDRIEKEAADA